MLDIGRIRREPREVERLLSVKGYEAHLSEMLDWDERRRALIAKGDELKSRRNTLSAKVPQMKKAGKDTAPLFDEVRQIGEEIKAIDAETDALGEKVEAFLLRLPNLPDPDLLPGEKENNQVIRVHGEKPSFNFSVKNHVELAEGLGLIDYQRGAKLGGSGKWLYTGDGALMEWALLNYFVETHQRDGYTFVLPPHILNYEIGLGSGQFPKFEEDVFWVGEREGRRDQFMLPTAETALVNLHRGEILNEEELPLKYFGYTPCYRSEAGSYRATERGMIRGNQFNKVEMIQYALPEKSAEAFEELVGKAEALMRGLGLHHQVSKLAAGDCSASMARTYDIEVWIPSMEIYKEVSSVSNSNDYQARRNMTRVRRKDTGKNEYVHILNGSGLATSRIFPAILEQNQQPDGSVRIPEPLQKWMGKDTLR